VTYEITAQHFGFTNWRWFVHATATLACVALVLFIETLIDSSPVTIKELIPILLTESMSLDKTASVFVAQPRTAQLRR
jgi:hypothetical protein